jgi:hypothetical protein
MGKSSCLSSINGIEIDDFPSYKPPFVVGYPTEYSFFFGYCSSNFSMLRRRGLGLNMILAKRFAWRFPKWWWVTSWYGYGSLAINCFFRGMNGWASINPSYNLMLWVPLVTWPPYQWLLINAWLFCFLGDEKPPCKETMSWFVHIGDLLSGWYLGFTYDKNLIAEFA